MNDIYKISKYVFFSKNIICSKYTLAYSTITNKILAIEKDMAIKIQNEEFEDVDSDIFQKLIEYEFVRPAHINELQEVINRFKSFINDDDLLYQVIQPSANCQLGCDYCGQVHNNKNITNKNVDEKIFNRIVHNLSKKDYKTLGISWFGGEPLMGLSQLKKMSKRLIALTESKSIDYTAKMVTNGLSLKKEIFYDLFLNYKISSFEVTLDGTAEFHDDRRYTKSGKRTFNLILKNLEDIVNDKRFANSGVNINIRSNIDGENYKDTENLINILEEKNILKYVNFYLAPLHSWGNDAHKKTLNREEFAKFELEVALKLIEKNKRVQTVPKRGKDIVCMSLYDNSELFDAEGNVYNCSEVSQVPVYAENNYEYRIGNLSDHSHPNIDKSERPFANWNDEILEKKTPCYDCKLLPICGGACPKLWKEGMYPCPSMKTNFEDRIFLQFYQDNLDENKEFKIRTKELA
ncbi:radical SAM/SPASM domain-containing protein [Chryseobacterium piperi]|uniref:radical SAM/SPASM domain-containing protein n=1 Tax=Chryseobacterium piperi TaxID=558152 RepID=UPI0006903F1B|nr:radical SAM protein [Chryseobacterium piperi]ASW74368.1 radical SAM/SPASM domain-containing protein [Chryseobacterium piperi]